MTKHAETPRVVSEYVMDGLQEALRRSQQLDKLAGLQMNSHGTQRIVNALDYARRLHSGFAEADRLLSTDIPASLIESQTKTE